MKPSNVVVNPLGGARADFLIAATASLSAGQVVSLRKTDEDGRKGMIALIESSHLIRGQMDMTNGVLDILATYDNGVVGPPPPHIDYGHYWCERTAEELLAQYYGQVPILRTSENREFEPRLHIGALRQSPTVPVSFSAGGFEKHTAIFAQSGSGKSYALGVLIEELISKTTARVIIIDPNGDYGRMQEFHPDAGWTDLQRSAYSEEMGRIPTLAPSSLNETEKQIDDVITGRYRGAIFNLNRVELLLWNKVIWTILQRLWRNRDAKVPTLLVIDESHHFAPAGSSYEDESPLQTLTRIAAEGRKYGLWLVLATQRPQKLDANIISQCDNLIMMKLTSRADTEYVCQVYNGISREMTELAYGFSQGEALAVGRLVKSPTLFRFRRRNTLEGGADLAHDWATTPVRAQVRSEIPVVQTAGPA